MFNQSLTSSSDEDNKGKMFFQQQQKNKENKYKIQALECEDHLNQLIKMKKHNSNP